MNKNWPRWIFISVAKHFQSALASHTIFFVEGQHMDTTGEPDRIELRIDGPFCVPLSKKHWHLYTEVNLLITVTMSDSNMYRKQELVGLVAEACIDIICKKWEEGVSDPEVLGCLRMKVHPEGVKKDWLEISHFGQIEQQTKIQQVSVEVHYEMELIDNVS